MRKINLKLISKKLKLRSNRQSQIASRESNRLSLVAYREKGFTLAELVVVIALFALLSVFAVGIFISNNRFYSQQSGKIIAVNSTREIGDRINELGRTASGFKSSHTYDSVIYTTGEDTVVFEIPSVDSDGEVIEGSTDVAIFAQDPNDSSRFVHILDADPDSSRAERQLQMTDSLSEAVFTYDNSDLSTAKLTQYEITVTKTGRDTVTEKVVGKVTIRN